VTRHTLAYLGMGRASLRLAAPEGDALVLLLGGAPFEEQLVMWWNFVARSHEEIVEQREAWNGTGTDFVPERFGAVADMGSPRLLAPPLPTVRLRPR
jgi:redox-sensitive bicupin YhaK (pirin superfamily)